MKLVPEKLDFRIKLMGQKIASILPYSFYRAIVKRHPKLSNPDYDKMIKYYIRNCSYVQPYGLDLRDKVIVETGSGAALVDPITFYLAGAAKIYTFDIRLHVNPQYVWGIIDHYENNLKELSDAVNVPLSMIRERWKIIKEIRDLEDSFDVPPITDNRFYGETKNFQDFLDATNINIYESQIIPEDIVNKSVDIFFSNSVLQRIKLKWLDKMVSDASYVLKEDGVFWHKIDCRDINWLYDKTISRYHYLKYSDCFFNIISSELYNYQNRLRQIDFLNIFKESGFVPIYLKSQRPDNYGQELSQLKINKRFNRYKREELAITNFVIYAVREKVIGDQDPVIELKEFPANIENQFL